MITLMRHDLIVDYKLAPYVRVAQRAELCTYVHARLMHDALLIDVHVASHAVHVSDCRHASVVGTQDESDTINYSHERNGHAMSM